MKEILEAYAAVQNWNFEYGRADFNNLFEGTEIPGKGYLFLDPVEINYGRNDTQFREATNYSGSFMLLKSSDIDEEDYNTRYETYIKPMIDSDIEDLEDHLICEHDLALTEWRIIEVINFFDYNFDGVLVTFRTELSL